MSRVAGFIAAEAEDHVVATITPRPSDTKILGLPARPRSQLVKTRDRIFHLKEYASHHDADPPLHWFGGRGPELANSNIGRPAASVRRLSSLPSERACSHPAPARNFLRLPEDPAAFRTQHSGLPSICRASALRIEWPVRVCWPSKKCAFYKLVS